MSQKGKVKEQHLPVEPPHSTAKEDLRRVYVNAFAMRVIFQNEPGI